MKILVICQYYFPEQFRINDICESLAKKGHNVTVLTGLPNYPEGRVPKEYKFFRKRKENYKGVNIIRTFEIGRRQGAFFRLLNYLSYMVSASCKAIFLKEKYDIVYIYQLSPITMAIPGIIYKKIHKKKIVLYCLDLWPESVTTFGIKANSILYKAIERISNHIYKQIDQLVVSSEMFKQELQNKNKSDIIYMPQYAEEIFQKKGTINNGIFDFVFAGNIGKVQSVETIIKAAKILEKNPKIKFHIIGDGSTLGDCKRLAEDLRLKNICFYGKKNLNEMQQYYELADAMIVTLGKNEVISKTLPAKIQTCMLAGKPIIAAANGAIKKIISEANCGMCSEAEDEQKLAENLKKFTQLSEKEIKNMGDNAEIFYNENFRKHNFIEKLIQVLEREGNNNV